MLHYIRLALRTPGAQRAARPRARRPGSSAGNRAVRHLSRASAAARTTTSTSTPAAPIRSTGSACSKLIGREDLIADPRFDTAEARAEHEREVNADRRRLDAAQHDKHEAMRMLGAAGVPAGAVLDTMELADEPDLLASAASCRRCSIRDRRLRDAGLAGALRRRAARGRGRRRCSAQHSAEDVAERDWLEPRREPRSARAAGRRRSHRTWRRRAGRNGRTMAELTGSEILAKA